MNTNHDAETRLRAALHRAADRVEVDDFGSLERIRTRAGVVQRRRRLVAAGSGLAVAIVAVAVGVSLLRDGGRGTVTIVPAGTGEQPGSTTSTTEGDSTVPTTSIPASPPVGAVFPAAVADATDDPIATVERFLDALGYGMHELDPFVAQGQADGVVPVVGLGEDGTRFRETSRVSLSAQDGLWYVVGASSDRIEIDSPVAGATVASPVTVSGRASSFEAQMIVEVRDSELREVGQALPLAGCCEALLPFSADIGFGGVDGPGAIVVSGTTGLENGAVDLAVAPVVLAPGGVTTVQVYLLDGETPVAVTRTVPKTTGVLGAAIGQLLAGPTAQDEALGFGSMFSAATASVEFTVHLEGGTAVLDFDPNLFDLIPNVSASTASMLLLAQLELTVFQFENIQRVEFRLGGDCEAFFNWLERTCEVVERP